MVKKCVDFLIDSNKCTEQPSTRAYQLSIEKLLGEAKNIERYATRSGDSGYELFLNQCYKFPLHDSRKCVSKLTSSDSLNIETSFREVKRHSSELCNEKAKLTSKVSDLQSTLAGFETKLDSKEQKLSECKNNLKRTAAREKYNASKVRILKQSLNEECCTESRDRITFKKKPTEGNGKGNC